MRGRSSLTEYCEGERRGKRREGRRTSNASDLAIRRLSLLQSGSELLRKESEEYEDTHITTQQSPRRSTTESRRSSSTDGELSDNDDLPSPSLLSSLLPPSLRLIPDSILGLKIREQSDSLIELLTSSVGSSVDRPRQRDLEFGGRWEGEIDLTFLFWTQDEDGEMVGDGDGSWEVGQGGDGELRRKKGE